MATNTKKKFSKRKRKFDKSNVGNKKEVYMDDRYEYGDKETNDPAWYAKYPELMRDAASIPYSIPTGTKISWDLVIDPAKPMPSPNANSRAFESIPGIMTLGVVPCVGVSEDATSPVNVASDFLYTKVRAENSGARNYDSPDLMLYCLAMDQVYSLLTWYNRIYGKLMLYSQVNRYLPKALLESEWVDFDDMIIHINDFKGFLDIATAQAAAFSVPNDITLFNRHAFMYQNIYKDAESPKSQIYQFAPRVFYYYDEYNGAGRLMPIDIVNSYPNKLKFSDLVLLFHSLMNPIISAEDFNIMSGDILKAFGPDHLIKLQLMPSGYTINPIADYEVLTQIKNATMSNLMTVAILGINSQPSDWAIQQDPNVDYIIWNPPITYGTSQRNTFSRDRILSTYKTTPEPADNMVYSRLMYAVKEVDETTDPSNPRYTTYFDAVGSEFIVGVNVTYYYTSASGWDFTDTNILVISENAISMGATNMTKVWACRHFDFSPCVYLFVSSAIDTIFYPLFDTDNWTIVHAYELEKMHRTALMSMLRVPMIGSALGTNK